MAEVGEDLRLARGVTIRAADLTWRFSGSGGPGGQHANTSNTRAEVSFDIDQADGLPSGVRQRLLDRFGPSVSVACSDERSQWQNRRLALMRLEAQLNDALKVKKRRRPTRATLGSKKRRLKAKAERSETKKLRKRPQIDR